MSERPKNHGVTGQSLTRSTSIEIVNWGWLSDPLWVELRHGDWAGYLFRLTFTEGKLQGFEGRRESDKAQPLTAHLLQRVPLGALEREARHYVDDVMAEWIRGAGDRPINRELAQWYDDFEEGGRTGKIAMTERDIRLARLAKRYVETLGDPSQTAIIAREFSYSKQSVSKMVSEARQRHLLTPTQKGRPGGRLTPKAFAWLGEVPPPLLTAWDRATPEQRAGALEREQRRDELEDALTDGLRNGRMTSAEYKQEMAALYNQIYN